MSDRSFSADEVLGIVEHYPFFQGQLDELSIIPQRLVNQNARFRIGSRQWVIKRYDANALPANLALSHQLQLKLASANFPIAPLEVTKTGDSLIKSGSHAYSVHQWVQGIHHNPIETGCKISSKQIEQIAVMLGRFHALVTQQCEHHLEPDFSRARQLFASPLASANALFITNRLGISPYSLMKWKPKKSSLDRWILATLPKFKHLSKQLANIAPDDFPSLQDIILTHNDINWLNLIFDEQDQLLAIIDFDNLQLAPRQAEIGFAALVVTGSDRTRLMAFLEHYQAASGLTTDLAAIRLCMLVRCARSFLWSIQAYRGNMIEDIKMLEAWMRYLSAQLDNFSADPDFMDVLKA